LYSCILVNRLWCRLAIPLLWENPFSIITKNYHYCHIKKYYHYIEIYLYYLNEGSKVKFNEFGINNDLLPSNTLFNYPSFIKYLKTNRIYYSIKKWVHTLFVNQREKLEKLVYRSLFEVFIANEGILHSFEIVLSYNNIYCEYFNDAIELILQNPNFMYNIRNLELNVQHDTLQNSTNIIPFLKFLYSNCNSISSMIFHFDISDINDNNNSLIIVRCLSQLIISQHNLKIISFKFDTILYNPFLSLKNSNCSNTLHTIIFEKIDFKNIIPILQEVFDQLNVLESIHILYCYSLNSNFVQQIIKIIKPFKLKSLFMNQILHIESLQLLLQKSGNYLENFEFGFIYNKDKELRQPLLKLIIKYCAKIRYFTSCKPDDINIYLLIENISQTINYLTINFDDIKYGELCPIVLQNLGQVLPSKLEYLCLSFSFNISDFEIFLKNSQDTFIKKLLIRNNIQFDGESILFHIKEYIMKKERVKYLAYLEVFGFIAGCKDLFSLKDEVNEFKLHNIMVQKFSDLYITESNIIYNFI
jgi:hypothetical protein